MSLKIESWENVWNNMFYFLLLVAMGCVVYLGMYFTLAPRIFCGYYLETFNGVCSIKAQFDNSPDIIAFKHSEPQKVLEIWQGIEPKLRVEEKR